MIRRDVFVNRMGRAFAVCGGMDDFLPPVHAIADGEKIPV
jgi:hypothetical protein